MKVKEFKIKISRSNQADQEKKRLVWQSFDILLGQRKNRNLTINQKKKK